MRPRGEVPQQPALRRLRSCRSRLAHGVSRDAQPCPENAPFPPASGNTELTPARVQMAPTSGTPSSACFSKNYLHSMKTHVKSERRLSATKPRSRNKIFFSVWFLFSPTTPIQLGYLLAVSHLNPFPLEGYASQAHDGHSIRTATN